MTIVMGIVLEYKIKNEDWVKWMIPFKAMITNLKNANHTNIVRRSEGLYINSTDLGTEFEFLSINDINEQ